ncbi:MAG TPA: acetolactate synthase small subunit [Candidatus Omnitrophica bacterium]|nr:acetolactate synthase small subunit [Candidatus Omnitrophota bacterium]
MKYVLSVLVENKFGVLARIAGLFSARGFNIDSLAVGETDDPTISRMTIVVDADERTFEQVKKQLNKLIDVISIQDFTKKDYVDRELLLLKLTLNSQSRSHIIEIVELLEGRILHVGVKTICVEIIGNKDKITTALQLFKPYGIKEIMRTGTVAISKD